MGVPVISVRIAFATDPLAVTPTWTDVSAYVRQIHIRRGRQDELNRIEAGTAEIVLDNRDQRFDPLNTNSPYYPNVLPSRKVSIRATWLGTTYDLYTGYIERWPIEWPDSSFDATTTIACADGYKYFGNASVTMTVPVDFSGWQIKATTGSGGYNGILANLSWPPLDQNINAGTSIVQGWTVTNGNALAQLQLIADSENGYLWMMADGRLFFRERTYRLTNASSVTSQATFGSGAGELPFVAVVPAYDDSRVYNDVHVTRAGGVEQVAQDSASQVRYFKRTLPPKTGLLIGTDNESADAANWLLAQYKDADVRFTSLTLSGLLSDSLWPHMLGRDFGDRITVAWRPPGYSLAGGAGAVNQDCFIEGVEHAITRDDWRVGWNLSPASSLTYWILGSTTLSVLGSTTRVGY